VVDMMLIVYDDIRKGKEKFKCHLQWFYRTFDTKLTKQQKPPNFLPDSVYHYHRHHSH